MDVKESVLSHHVKRIVHNLELLRHNLECRDRFHVVSDIVIATFGFFAFLFFQRAQC